MKTFPSEKKFKILSKTRSFFPLWSEMGQISETPRSLFKKLYLNRPYSFLLESGKGPEKISRYSFLGGNPIRILKSKGPFVEIIESGKNIKKKGNPFTELDKVVQFGKEKDCPILPHFWGGWVGFIGYDAIPLYKKSPIKEEDTLNLPDTAFILFKEMIVFDHIEDKVTSLIIIDTTSKISHTSAVKLLDDFTKRIHLKNKREDKEKYFPCETGGITSYSNQLKNEYEENVLKAKEYIRDGDIYQANISRRIETTLNKNPFDLYEQLFMINPSPFSAYLNFEDFFLVCGSPERLIKIDEKGIMTRPIAGTRPRGSNPMSDLKFSKELLLNEKERAEHLMLVDLERNDLGRICQYGSIQIDEFMALESYSHVWHIISNITGRLRKDIGLDEILPACFPGGTITGCPKIRCMEIINELEPHPRGPYTGSLGYIGFEGKLDLNIIIRSIIVKNKKAYIHAGAGIVADSIPEKEFYETEKKAAAMLEALSTIGNSVSKKI